jgi:hypothetical protein
MQGHNGHKACTTTTKEKYVVDLVVLRGLCDLHLLCVCNEAKRYF